jgi:hypothetical protein
MRINKKFVRSVAIVLSLTAITISFNPLNATASLRHATSLKGIVHGQVLLGPICPVERNPPNPVCAPKPYKTTINIFRTVVGTVYKKVATDASGHFTISLAPGVYILRARSGAVYPRCADRRIKVLAKKSQNVKINCDTGIR